MRPQPPPEHVQMVGEVKSLLDEALAIRDREAEKLALCQQIQRLTHWQESLRRWLSLSQGPDARWHGISFADAEKMLDVLEQEKQELSRALVNLLQTRPRRLTDEEEEALDHYESHEYAEPPLPTNPDLAEPGSPEKVQLLSDRLHVVKCGLWHPHDAELAPTERTEYRPRHAAGNYATVGRELILFLLVTDPERQST